MTDITELKVGSAVKCVFAQSPFFGRMGIMLAFEHDGWIRVLFADDETTRLCHPNDVEIVKLVEYDQYAALRQEADDLHKQNRELDEMVYDLAGDKNALQDCLAAVRNQVITLYRQCMSLKDCGELMKESMFIGGLNHICKDITQEDKHG